jgi:hypothetical protein
VISTTVLSGAARANRGVPGPGHPGGGEGTRAQPSADWKGKAIL